MNARALTAALAAVLAVAPMDPVADPAAVAIAPPSDARDATQAGDAADAPPATDPTGATDVAAAPADLNLEQVETARIAWRYFERNYQPSTGLVNSVDGYPNTSMWDVGSTVLATLAAHELGLIDAATFATRVDALLWTLTMQRLFQGELPNKA